MIHISLGSDCSISYHLQEYGLRSQSFPFDWILSPKIEKCIETDFIDLYNPSFYIKKKMCKMPYLSEDWEENVTDLYRVYHSSYQFTFLHDFKDGIEINDVIEKYKRRVDRFLTIMKDPTIHKKLYRMGKGNLKDLFDKKGYVNYTYYHEPMFQSTDWKKNEFNWLNYIKE
jgi:hypothetical protein